MRVGCGSQCQGSTHLSVFEFSISNSSLKKKSGIFCLSSFLLINQPVYREFETTVKSLKSSEAQGGTFR